jgi:hypothetical protein
MKSNLMAWILVAGTLAWSGCGGGDDATCTDCDADVPGEAEGGGDADADGDADEGGDAEVSEDGAEAEAGEPCTGSAECDDDLFCNGVETCSGGFCAAGEAPALDDGVDCTDDSCDEDADEVLHTPDNTECTHLDGEPTCDVDGRVAQVTGVCDPEDDCIASTGIIDDCTDAIAHPPTFSCAGDTLMREAAVCVPAAGTDPAACEVQSTVDTDCTDPPPTPHCTGSASTGDLAFLSDGICLAASDGAECSQVSAACTAAADACAAGTLTTSVAFCDPGTGCDTLDSTGSCPTTPNHCEGTTFVTYAPTCADATTCGTGVETRSLCPTPVATCEGQVYRTWASHCDPTTGCGAIAGATTDCDAMDSLRCASTTSSETTNCSCDVTSG